MSPTSQTSGLPFLKKLYLRVRERTLIYFKKRNTMKIFIYFLCFATTIVLLAAGPVSYLLWFQPPFYFPKPTGPYAVGTKEYHWIDTSRKEIYSDDPAHPYRELMIKIWFPAQGNLPEKPTTPYAPYFVNANST